MTELLLIRHGETDWNAERRLQGHLDIALNETGARQARALGRALRSEGLAAIYSSDLQRAWHTAQVASLACGLPVHAMPALRERCYGAFEGLRHADILERYPLAHCLWQARDVDARMPAGVREAETLREFSGRVRDAIVGIAQAHALQKIAIVTHGGVLECIYRAAKEIGWAAPRNFEIRNAGINRVAVVGAALHIVQWSEVGHLAGVALDEIDG